MFQDKDRELKQQIQSMLDSHKEFKGYGLEVDVHKGKVQLSGIVDTLADGNRAVEIISQIKGVRAVENGVTVSTDGAITDPGVAMEVSEELKADPRVKIENVGPESAKGKVFLRGTVDSPEEEKAAVEAASKARGVKEVVSELNIRTEGGYGTDDLEAIFHHQVNNDQENNDRRDF